MIRSAMLPSIAQLYHNSTLHCTSGIDSHHGKFRFIWRLVLAVRIAVKKAVQCRVELL